jgi:hypothetical protein
MSAPKKKAVVSKRVSDDQILNSNRWIAFIEASGTPYENLSESWLAFFDGQAEIETATVELVKLIDAAIKADNLRDGTPSGVIL